MSLPEIPYLRIDTDTPWQKAFKEHEAERNSRVVVVSGYFNPVHVGHLDMLRDATKYGGHVVVIVNNDRQVRLKGSCPFMCVEDRIKIVERFKWVSYAFPSIDEDLTVARTLGWLKKHYTCRDKKMIFANGGDRTEANELEKFVCDNLGIEMVFGLGDKTESSSNLIKRAVDWYKEQQNG